ncbi:hypothetical protein N7457_004389 [Penicillium paradoxum]|uniref:uncharacterized protein n=1 Tax=Penicillium paradoxum TaxID=176176 RepID=UPI002546CF8C|nr:uncharacterized protein N7457_004389 [Penicillium paradoxum]KAJ5782615.1 hypothetical protein N7457_004389 [Penicillium paradoxum]
MDSSIVLDWYRTLNSRVVDLVGDFAGNELFIIEGDSLLLQCFSDKKLDFNPGFQVLHATYLAEQLLQKLQQRKCVFQVVFFTQNTPLCIPPGIHGDLHKRYLLAREAIIQHLLSIPIHSSQYFQAFRFESYQSEEFKAHLINSGAYMFMCHDGAFSGYNKDDPVDDTDSSDSETSDLDSNSEDDDHKDLYVDEQGEPERLRLRRMIYWIVAHGINVALINSLVFRDTKIMAMVIESSSKTTVLPSVPEPRGTDSPTRNDELDYVSTTLSKIEIGDNEKEAKDTPVNTLSGQDTGNELSNQVQIHKALEKTILDNPGLSQRQCLLVVTLGTMLLDDAVECSDNRIGAESMILHLVLLQATRLSDRSIKATASPNLKFFNKYVGTAQKLLGSKLWQKAMEDHGLSCDLSDLMDGTLFFEVQIMVKTLGISKVISPATLLPFNDLARLVDRICGTKLQCKSTKKLRAHSKKATPSGPEPKHREIQSVSKTSRKFGKVLPFTNAIFDAYLEPVQLQVDKSVDLTSDAQISKEFKEKSHWHSSKPLHQKAKVILTPEEVLRHQKRNQFFMAEMRDYAASLTGSTGLLQPEPIIVESFSDTHHRHHPKHPSMTKAIGGPSSTSKSNKKSHSASGKPTAKETAAAYLHQKAIEARKKQIQKWEKLYQKDFSRIDDLVLRLSKLNDYLATLPKDSRQILQPEVLTCMVDTLLRIIFVERLDAQVEKHTLIVIHIWEIITRLMKIKQGISTDIATYVRKACHQLGLPNVQLNTDSEQQLSFQPFQIPKAPNMSIAMPSVEFQLLHGGPFMDRSIESLPDSRTPDFEPDLWQREVLDQIDAKRSLFIVAPTSAGKTFISFYAMKQILKEDDDGILVYVAPTKALVNQIAAEVQARFSKAFPAKTSGKSVWAIHTRDYRINSPMGCQVLITVPSILQIMLLAPANAQAWTPRIKRIIFDEIHCIGQAEDGVVWEQLLLMSPCPIIALSATVGNPQEFYDWLHLAQKTNGFDLKMIQHRQRYSDLRKYIYQPCTSFKFKRFLQTGGLPRLGLDLADDMKFIHPVTSLVDRSRLIPDDFDLEPRDCFTLWKAMHDLKTERFPVDSSLEPSHFFSDIVIQKVHVIEWQKRLKQLLGEWMKDRKSPFETLLRNLQNEKGCEPVGPTDQKASNNVSQSNGLPSEATDNDLLNSTLPLIFSLHAQNALPALFFNYDRSQCEGICLHLLTELQNSEAVWKADSPVWKSKVAKWESWKVSKHESTKKLQNNTKKRQIGNGDKDEEPISKAGLAKESASAEFSWLDSFDPKTPVDGFHLADFKKISSSEFSEYTEALKYRHVPQWLIDALERGIGVHHAGMNRKYRQVCEILFRKGFLRVVIATGTLALGINMPCKTVVFSGDSIFLTALNFRQAAGRAGRRGFDMLGNVVFQMVPPSKIKRLIGSKLPSLNGHFPITTTLVLRLFILQHGSDQAPSAVKLINSILSSPRIFLGGAEMRDTVLHHLRFSIEYLRRNNLLSSSGTPLNFAGCISHLYYTENSSFAFHALLNSGYLQELCQDIKKRPQKTLRTLMLVMAHLFGRIPLRQATLELYQSAEKKPPSIVTLPHLPAKAASVLRAHNKQVLGIYTNYVSSFVNQHLRDPDHSLPFSGIQCGGDNSAAQLGFTKFNHLAASIISPFYALSGNQDTCDSIFDLSQMVRSGVWLEDSVIPYVAVLAEENAMPLNAYLYDFFKHGNVTELLTANRIRRGDVWFLLNDFSLILATITTSIEAYLSPGGNIDPDMLDVSGGGEVHENSVNDKAIERTDAENQKKVSLQPATIGRSQSLAAPLHGTSRSRAKKVVDSWEDEMGEDDLIQTADKARDHQAPQKTINKAKSKAKLGKPTGKPQGSMLLVAQAFRELQTEFDSKFKAMWA